MARIFIVGNGYVGSRVALAWLALRPVTIISRSDRNIPVNANLQFVRQDLDLAADKRLAESADSILYYFVPPPRQGRNDSRLQNFLTMIDPAALPRKIVLISTTGVYGDNGGAWVSEDTPTAPRFDRAHRRLHAETTLRYWAAAHGVNWVILRLPAIYGPGKLPLEAVKSGKPVICREDSPWVNRIFIDDLVNFCLAAGKLDSVQGIFNISDGHPALMTDFFFKLADAFGIARPPLVSLAQARESFSEGMLSYLAESRRVDASKAMRVLGVTPFYPDLDAGLRACVAAEKD